MSEKDKKDKKDYPVGSRQNPVVLPPSSQAGLQAIKNRQGGTDKSGKKK